MQPPQLRRSPRGCSPASAAAGAGSSPRWSCSSASSTPASAASAAAAATAALALLLALAAAPVTTASPAPVAAPSASARRLLAAVASASNAVPVPAPGGRPHPVAKRSFFDLQCKGVYDKSIFARLDRICEDCYNLFREPQLHSLCRKNCFTSDYFKGCLDVLLLQDEMEKIQTWIKQLHGADPGV